MSANDYVGVLLAAGRSRRMGALKQLLPVDAPSGKGPMVVAAFDAIAGVCGGRMLVVTGHEPSAVAAALGARRFTEVRSEPDADMFHSVRLGLGRARLEHPDAPGYILHLADHPFVRPETVAALRDSFEAGGRSGGVMPVHANRGGHPVLISPAVVDEILGWHGRGGVRAFWVERPDLCRRLEVNDPGVIADLDTPGDYQASISAPSPPSPAS